MDLPQLTSEEEELALRCIRLMVNLGLIEDWEFHCRIGFHREEATALLITADQISAVDLHSGLGIVVNNCLNEICNGLYLDGHDFNAELLEARPQLKLIFRKWRQSR